MKKYLWLVILCTVIISIPTISTSIFGGDPILFHIARIKSISEGNFWIYPTWLFDFGEPVGIFYPWLFLCIPALFLKLGLSIELVINIFSFLIIVATVISSCIAGKIMFKSDRMSVIFAISYIIQWYIQANIFLLTDFSTALANIFLPLAFASSICLLKNHKGHKNLWIIAAFAYTGLIESNLLSSAIFFSCLVILWIIQIFIRRTIDIVDLEIFSKIFLSVLGLNLFFIVPFIYFHLHMDLAMFAKDTRIDSINIFYLIFLLKKIYFAVIPIFIFTAYKIHKGELSKFRRMIFYFGWITAIIVAIVASDVFPWYAIEEMNLGNILEKTWQFMSIFSLAMALIMTVAIATFKKYLKTTLIVLTLYSMTFGANIWIGEPQAYLGWFNWRTVKISYNESYATFQPDGKTYPRINSLIDDYSHKNAQIDDIEIWLEYWDQRADKKEIPVLFFDGYKAFNSAGNAIRIERSSRNLIRLDFNDDYTLIYEGLLSFKIAIVISIGTALVLLFIGRKNSLV